MNFKFIFSIIKMPTLKRKLIENEADKSIDVLLKKKNTEDPFVKHFCWNADDNFIQQLQSQLQFAKKEIVNIPAFSDYNCSLSLRTSEKVFFSLFFNYFFYIKILLSLFFITN